MNIKLNEKKLSQQIEQLTEKAINALESIISDDSRYLVFQWTISKGQLQIGLAKFDNKHEFILLAKESYSELAFDVETDFSTEDEELLRFWLTDYLSTSASFFQYALIALFHKGDASKSQLL